MNATLGYLARRLLAMLVTLALVSIIVFTLIRSIPGDPVALMFGEALDPAQMAQMRERLGLDQPLPAQYLAWLKQVMTGDFGESIRTRLPVLPLILEKFQVSVITIFTAVLIAALLAVPAGTFAAWRQGTPGDFAIIAGSTLLLSIPSFWLGLLLLLLFGIKLNWLPVLGYVPFTEDGVRALQYVMLPIVTLTLIEIGVLTRMARANAVDVLRLEYVTHARAKGLPERLVLFRHVFPNAFAPTLTLIGLIIGNLLGGIAVLETVFALPGFGHLLVDAVFARDYPVIQGCLLFTAFFFVVINTLIDLLYPAFDPRVAAE